MANHDRMRMEFEKWAESHGSLEVDSNGLYVDVKIFILWVGFCAGYAVAITNALDCVDELFPSIPGITHRSK